MIRRLTIVGLGLLGGSLAKAARAESLAREIVAVGRRVGSLEPALADGAVDRITTDLEAQLPAVWRAAAEGALVTDVGSAKARIVRAAEALATKRPLAFVGGHPMAGSNLAGYGVSRADLFRGALVILTPTERTSVDALKRASELWEAVGSRVMSLDPVTHDRAVAAVSHLPHLVADALVAAVARMDPQFFDVAARGFKDTTRIAASDPVMWRDIFDQNREALAEALAAFRAALGDLESLVRSGDGARIEAELERIRALRERLG